MRQIERQMRRRCDVATAPAELILAESIALARAVNQLTRLHYQTRRYRERP
jgi:hypothetical protein